jgi:hypothetical protein
MATTPTWGTDGSVTTAGFGCHFNAFSTVLSQGFTQYFGYGDTWMKNRGTIASWSGNMAGFTTSGSTTDLFTTVPILSRAGVSITLTYATGCTVAGTVIVTESGAQSQFLGTNGSNYSFVGDGAPTITWA